MKCRILRHFICLCTVCRTPFIQGFLCIKRANAYDSETSKRLRGYAGLSEPSLVALALSIPVAPKYMHTLANSQDPDEMHKSK